MPNEPLLPEPKLTETQQGVDTYPRVICQDKHGDSVQLVTFAIPGLRRVRMWVPLAQWLNLDHLAVHPTIMAQLEHLMPPLQLGREPDDTETGQQAFQHD